MRSRSIATFCVDGVADGTAAGAAGFVADSVGNDPAGDAFKGRLDEVRVYVRALSAAEVAALAGPPKPPAGLIAHWPLEEGSGATTADASGGGRTGTLTGGTSRTAGQIGSGALSFDGVTGRMTFSALPLTTAYTVSLWIHPVPSSQNYAALLTEGQQYGIWYRGSSRKLDLIWAGGTAAHLNETPLTENQWHHIAVVNNAGNAAFYVDGVADGTAAGAAGFIADSIGYDAAGDAFKGRLDDVRVYDRALNAAEVAALAGPLPGLAIVSATPGEVVLTLRVDGSRSYAVEASTDLDIWVQLPNVLTCGTNQVTDSSGAAQRFYRLVPLP